MGTTPFDASAKLPTGPVPKLPKQRLSAEERLRRLEEAIAFLQQHLATGPHPTKTLLAYFLFLAAGAGAGCGIIP
jgi:hypothetical protein